MVGSTAVYEILPTVACNLLLKRHKFSFLFLYEVLFLFQNTSNSGIDSQAQAGGSSYVSRDCQPQVAAFQGWIVFIF